MLLDLCKHHLDVPPASVDLGHRCNRERTRLSNVGDVASQRIALPESHQPMLPCYMNSRLRRNYVGLLDVDEFAEVGERRCDMPGQCQFRYGRLILRQQLPLSYQSVLHSDPVLHFTFAISLAFLRTEKGGQFAARYGSLQDSTLVTRTSRRRRAGRRGERPRCASDGPLPIPGLSGRSRPNDRSR